MNIEKVEVEEIDILKTTEFFNTQAKEVAAQNATEEQIKAYDLGVKNTMSILEHLIAQTKYGKKDRLIYLKYGEPHLYSRYKSLSKVLEEMQIGGKND